MKPNRNNPPVDRDALERLALRYVERFATTRAKLTRYLERKLYERGWADAGIAPVAGIVTRFVELGYVDDRAFAAARADAMVRRGYGRRRIADALRADGVAPDDMPGGGDDEGEGEGEARKAALAFARRRRIGPFAATPPDRTAKERAFAAMMRAGHPPRLIREILDSLRQDDNIA